MFFGFDLSDFGPSFTSGVDISAAMLFRLLLILGLGRIQTICWL